MKLAALFAAALLTGCSRQAELNYKHCLKLRVGMTKADMVKVMGEPETTIPFVEGKSLDYLKGRTAYEWSNPASMPGGDHVSLDDASGKIESIRCSNAEITAAVFVEPPAPSTATAVAPSTAPAAPAAAAPSAPAAPAPSLAAAFAAYRKKDFVNAMKIAGPFAQNGDPDAQFLAGLIFLNGAAAGHEKDGLNVAQMWLYKASRQKHAEAQAVYTANLMASNGPSTTIIDEAKTAAATGNSAGLRLLAKVYLSGDYADVTPKDEDEGEKWLLKAAQAGDPTGQLDLAHRMKDKKDLVESYHWALLASRHPVTDKFTDPEHSLSSSWTQAQKDDAAKLIMELRAGMKPAQIEEAQTRATAAP
ncbi:MAG TPA: tetratricopeptide repeat protein [Elusimicrobiota bacterium]|nr:tetratricopeptide repeat protein [Elusimicrobiota bacterium]